MKGRLYRIVLKWLWLGIRAPYCKIRVEFMLTIYVCLCVCCFFSLLAHISLPQNPQKSKLTNTLIHTNATYIRFLWHSQIYIAFCFLHLHSSAYVLHAIAIRWMRLKKCHEICVRSFFRICSISSFICWPELIESI